MTWSIDYEYDNQATARNHVPTRWYNFQNKSDRTNECSRLLEQVYVYNWISLNSISLGDVCKHAEGFDWIARWINGEAK
jgi:hypothetical protein